MQGGLLRRKKARTLHNKPRHASKSLAGLLCPFPWAGDLGPM